RRVLFRSIVGLPVEVLVAAHQIITLVVGLPIAGGLSIWMWRLSCTPTRRSEITPRPMKVRLGRRPAADKLSQLAVGFGAQQTQFPTSPGPLLRGQEREASAQPPLLDSHEPARIPDGALGVWAEDAPYVRL